MQRENKKEAVSSLDSMEFLKKKSRLEIEKEQSLKERNIEQKENINTINNKSNLSSGYVALGDCLLKKKSRLEIEKEAYANLIKKARQEEHEKQKTLSHEDMILKVTDINHEEPKATEKEETKVKKSICGICSAEGPIIKGKIFPKCGHYFHSVSNN